MRCLFSLPEIWCFLNYGFLCVSTDTVLKSVMEGDSVILHTNVAINKQDKIKWYFNDVLIAQINGDKSKICTEVQCSEYNGRFRDRLMLDHQTGSLTVTNTKTTDSGLYELKIINNSTEKTFNVTVHGASVVVTDGVSVFVMEEDSVTLCTNVKINQQKRIRWYLKDILIAQINKDQNKICPVDQCKARFSDRLKLDHETGSLTIMNITNTDAENYKLKIISNSNDTENTFRVSVYRVSASERDQMKRKSVKEGESVSLDPDVITPNNLQMWYFNEILIAEYKGQSKICTDDQCKERFGNRLILNQNGSLVITNTSITDSGNYTLQINSSRFSIIRNFSVTVIDPDPDPSTHSVAIICGVGVLLVAIVASVICYYRRCSQGRNNGTVEQRRGNLQNGEKRLPLNRRGTPQHVNVGNGSSHNQSDASLMTAASGLSPERSRRMRRRKRRSRTEK